MTEISRDTDLSNPYKGQDSYGVEDASLFFGRERESTDLTARILANPLTILHAPSGAGKTSLLNARIIPALEAHGWLPVLSRPGYDDVPIDSVRRDTMHSLFPPVEAEIAALDAAMEALGQSSNQTIGDLCGALASRAPIASTLHRQLVSPIENGNTIVGDRQRAIPFSSTWGIMPTFQRATPYVCRVLRKTVEIHALAEHVGAIRSAGLGLGALDPFTDETTLNELRRALTAPELAEAYRALLSWLHHSPPGLRPFFENLTTTYGAEQSSFGVVLLMDQFEELFTQFGGRPRATRTPSQRPTARVRDWKRRDELFQELETVFHVTGANAPSKLPIRHVISLREEYIARLTRLRRFVPDLETAHYRLGWLSLDDARDAVQKPADRRDRTVAKDCIRDIIEGLAIEGAAIEPGPLQIVCSRMWRNHVEDESTRWERAITRKSLRPGVEALLHESFAEFLKDFSLFEKLELLDMIATLVTFSGTRNIVEREQLVNALQRKREPRQRLLDVLEKRRIVRVEKKLDGHYYEVTHEFLIEPIVNELTRNGDYRQLDQSLRELRTLIEGAVSGAVPKDVFDTLEHYKAHLNLSGPGAEIMLLSAVAHGAPGEVVRDWARRCNSERINVKELLGAPGFEGVRLLYPEELQELSSGLEEVQRPDQAERILRSLIAAPVTLDRAMLTVAVNKMREP